MSKPNFPRRFSTVADFELIADGQYYDVVQVASEFIILKTPQEIAPGNAELIIRVEGEVIRRQIALPQGSKTEMRRVPILRY